LLYEEQQNLLLLHIQSKEHSFAIGVPLHMWVEKPLESVKGGIESGLCRRLNRKIVIKALLRPGIQGYDLSIGIGSTCEHG
jgi:hypothetical protein